MEFSREELAFFNEGLVFTFTHPLISRIYAGDDSEAKYIVEVIGNRDEVDYSRGALHFRFFTQDAEGISPMMYNGKRVVEILLGFSCKWDTDYINFSNNESYASSAYPSGIMVEGSSSYEDFYSLTCINGMSLMAACKAFLIDALRQLSPQENRLKTKKM